MIRKLAGPNAVDEFVPIRELAEDFAKEYGDESEQVIQRYLRRLYDAVDLGVVRFSYEETVAGKRRNISIDRNDAERLRARLVGRRIIVAACN